MVLTTSIVGVDVSAADVSKKPQWERPRVGLVLSGGGARGFAHIGALQAFEELKIPFDVVAATSMGAMVGGGYAAGLSAGQIRDITLAVDWGQMFAPRPDRQKLSWREKTDDREGLSPGELGWGPQGLKLPSEVVPSQELDMFLARVNHPFNSINDLRKLSIPFAAMATDLETGEKIVLSSNVTLSQAMRASMSIPGAFAPAEYRGRMLVDGGLVDNLPVAQAKTMGADVVVAINVGTPLSRREKLTSFVGIMGQMVNLLTEQNVQASLKELSDRDIYIAPDLGELSSGDFRRAKEIIELGYQAVMKYKDQLKAYSVDPLQYRQWTEARAEISTASNEHHLARVEVRGLKRVNPKRVLADIEIDSDKRVANDKIEDAARNIWALGDFQSVPFHFEPGPRGTEVLVFEPTEKDWGYSSLRLGGNIQTDFESAHSFNLLLAHTWGWLNTWGAQWRNEVQIGEVKRLATEWYQPLGDAGNWFVMPKISYEWEPFDVYGSRGDTALAEYRNERLDVGVSLGYEMPRLGRVEFNAGWLDNRTVLEIGNFDEDSRAQAAYVGIGVGIDTLDNPGFPKEGVWFNANAYRIIDPSLEDMKDLSDAFYTVEAGIPVRLGKHTTLFLSGKAGQAPQPGSFHLGGVFNLSGSPYGRFSGNRMMLGRAMVYHDISRVMRDLRMPLYVGASFEYGRAWDEDQYAQVFSSDDSWQKGASIFIASDSWIGPIYLVAGRTFGHSNAITFYWGRLH